MELVEKLNLINQLFNVYNYKLIIHLKQSKYLIHLKN